MNNMDKPFWLTPPYLILFDLMRLHRIKPWDVNLASILEAFWKEMTLKGYIDFSASGTALLSSSIIHKMKSDLLLRMEEPPPRVDERPKEEVPPPLPIPLRLQYTATSISEVIDSLLSTLEREMVVTSRRGVVPLTPVEEPRLDEFFLNIEERIDSFYGSLRNFGEVRGGIISFIEYNRGLPTLNVIRNFILLLFLVTQGRVKIDQDNFGGDIRIRLI